MDTVARGYNSVLDVVPVHILICFVATIAIGGMILMAMMSIMALITGYFAYNKFLKRKDTGVLNNFDEDVNDPEIPLDMKKSARQRHVKEKEKEQEQE